MSSPDRDPCTEWLDEVVARYRSSLHAGEPIGDDDFGYLLQFEGSPPAEMAADFQEVLSAEKLAMLLAYAVQRCALQEIELEAANESPT